MHHAKAGACAIALAGLWCVLDTPALAQTATEQRLQLLEATLSDLLQRDEEREALIRKLSAEVDALRSGDRSSVEALHRGDTGGAGDAHGHHRARDHAHGHGGGIAGHWQEPGAPDLYAIRTDGGTLRLKSVGVTTALAAGVASPDSQEAIETLQGGGHDPKQTGFTVQAIDLSLRGGFDPWFDAVLGLSIAIDTEGETRLELEQAYIQSTHLPWGLEARAGHFFTEFGRINPLDVHDWDWIDQPVIATRLFGEDGARAPGLRIGWKGRYGEVLVGAQNARGETMASFLSSDEAFGERPIAGREFRDRDVDAVEELVYVARVAGKLGGEDGAPRLVAGISGLTGPNATGPDGRTRILGADLTFQASLGGTRSLTLAGEVMGRRYEADSSADGLLPRATFEDFGFYTEALLGFSDAFSGGLRYERVWGETESDGLFASRAEDPFRDDRWRLSPLLQWRFAPGARARVQYNLDQADHLGLASPEGDDRAHAVWLGLTWSFGAGLDADGHAH